MSCKHANARPSGERENQRHCNLLFNIYVNSIQICNECFSILRADSARHQNASLTVLGLIMWAAPYCKHKEPPFKRQYNASGIEEKKTDSHCQVYKVFHIKVPSHWIHAVFWDKHQASLLALGMEFKQPYLIRKNQIFPKLRGHFRFQHFFVWVWSKKHSVRE